MRHVSVSRGSAMPMRSLALVLAAVGLQPPYALGQETGDDTRVRTAPVVVTPTRVEQPAFDLPTAVTAIESQTIQEARPAVNISETLVRSPGTVVQNRETFAQEQQIIIRGFGARSGFGTRGVKLLADGIPASTPDGQGGPGLFDLNSARRIEVLRGPFSALYGNHSGGVVQIFTEDGPERPTVSGSFSAGSYDTSKTGLKFGGQNRNLNYIASASHFRTDGYRDHSRAQKDQFNSKFLVSLSDRSSLTAVINYLNQPDNQDPLGLDATQMAANPEQSIPQATTFNSRRDLVNMQAGVVYEASVTDADTLRVLAYLGRRRNEGYLAFGGTAFTSAGGVSVIDRDYHGLGARWTRRADLFARPLTVTVGADLDSAIDDRKGYVNSNGTAGVLKRDEENAAEATGGYVQAEWLFAQSWSATAGLRYTKVDFESTDHFVCRGTGSAAALPVCPGSPTDNAVNPDDSGSVRHHAWTPVAGLVFKATPTLNFYANTGKSFETPTLIELAYRPDGQPGLNLDLQPSTSWHYEVGAKFFLGESTSIETAIFQIDTDDEIVIAANVSGRQTFKNAGKTQRRGAELSMTSSLRGGFAVYLAATYLDATFEESFCSGSLTVPCPPANTVDEGKRIPAVPKYNGLADLAWRYPKWGMSTGVELRWQGDVPVNDRNTEFAGSYWTAGVRVFFAQNVGGWRFSEFARIDNLFDERYVSAVYVNDANGRFYAPAPGRNGLVGVSAVYSF